MNRETKYFLHFTLQDVLTLVKVKLPNLTKLIDKYSNIYNTKISFIKSIIKYIFIINLSWFENVIIFFFKLSQT